MSERAELSRIRQRVADKWQIPTLLAAVALLVGSLLQIESPQAEIPFDTLCERISAEVEGQMYSLAASDCRRLLKVIEDRDEPESELQAKRGRVHLLLARALAPWVERLTPDSPPDEAAAAEIVRAYQLAAAAGQELAWQDHRRVALAHEWLESFEDAAASYREALPGAGPEALDLRRRILELMQGPLHTPTPQIHQALDAFLADATDRPELLLWAAEQKTELLVSEDREAEAPILLASLRPTFEPTGYRQAFEYLVAWALYRASRPDEAEALLRDLRNRLTVRDEVYAKSGWLLGRVVLNDGGPQRPAEAASFFRDVIAAQVTGLYLDASRLGLAEALAALERFDEALEHYETAIASLGRYAGLDVLNPDLVRASMTAVAGQLRQSGDLERALAFLEPAAALVEPENVELASTYLRRRGDWSAALAQQLRAEGGALPPDDPQFDDRRDQLHAGARELLTGAGETFIELARINTLNEPRSAAATWRAADLFDQAGDRARTIAVLDEFVRERPNSSLAPQALLRLGQSLQAVGRYREAIEAYQENQRRFPRTPDAGSALIPLARCFMALGTEYHEQAERTCQLILENSPIFTPEAPEFADALFLLGDLYSRQGNFEAAIPTLNEAVERYPDDPRLLRAEFLLADAYRQSGLALRRDLEDPKLVGQRPRLKAESVNRLTKAAELFNRLVQRYEGRDESELGELEALFLRYGRLYEADCLFELLRYEEALKRYERTAWTYRGTASALAAYVQIINCHVYLGRPEEARAALRRAQHLVTTIPQFPELAGTRQEWERYFNWAEQSELF